MNGTNLSELPEGVGYILGIAIGMPSLIIFGFVIDNIPLGIAWLMAGYAIGITLEGENQKSLTLKQKKYAVLSVISGAIMFAIYILLFNYVV
jgi:hypothetical protein